MIHGPCGQMNPNCVCMDKETNKCSKEFPKQFSINTTDDNDSFPTYRRRSTEDGGHIFINPITNLQLDNKWVVPYNPYLLLKYDCHINVEICNSITSVKYLYKYVYKGDDKANITIVAENNNVPQNNIPQNNNVPQNDIPQNNNVPQNDIPQNNYVPQQNLPPNNNVQQPDIPPNEENAIHINEINKYTAARYVGACNAMWRIYGYEMEERDPNVIRLQLHLPNQQQIYYHEGQEIQALQNERNQRTMLTSYFETIHMENVLPLQNHEIGHQQNGQLYPMARNLTYQDFPTFYS